MNASADTQHPPLWQWRLQTPRIKAKVDQTLKNKRVQVRLASTNVSLVSQRGPASPGGQEQIWGPTQEPPF